MYKLTQCSTQTEIDFSLNTYPSKIVIVNHLSNVCEDGLPLSVGHDYIMNDALCYEFFLNELKIVMWI